MSGAAAVGACISAVTYSSHMHQDFNNNYNFYKYSYYMDYSKDKLIKRILKSVEKKIFIDMFKLLTPLKTIYIYKHESNYTDDLYFREEGYIQPSRLKAKELNIEYSWWFKSFIVPEYTILFLDRVRQIEDNNIEVIFRSDNRKYLLKISTLDKNFNKIIMEARSI